jgi:signal transduction histidine kinase
VDEQRSGRSAALSALSRAQLDELLTELLGRVHEVADTQERLGGLLDAVVGLAGDLGLDSVLQRIVDVAGQLVGAKYAALGVLGTGTDHRLSQFVTYGLSDAQREEIGHLPRGHGILGVIIDRPEPLRLMRIKDHPQTFGFPDNHPPMDTFLGTPIRIRDKVFGNLYLTEKQSPGGFTKQDEELVVALAAAAGVVIENARLYEVSAQRQQWLEAAAAITAALLGPVERDRALQLVADRARDVAGADRTAVLLRHSGDRLMVEVVSGLPDDDAVGTAVPTDETLPGGVLGTGRPRVVEDLADGSQISPGSAALPVGWPAEGALVLLPLPSPRGADGVLLMGWAPANAHRLRGIDLQMPAAFAEQAALALQVASMQEDQARLAVFEDRDRIGRDLHDLVIQRLFAVGLGLESAARLPDPEAVAARISTAVDEIDETIRDIRRTIFEISSSHRSGPQLRRQVNDVVGDATAALGLEPNVRLRGPVDSAVSPQTREHLLATLREALSNAAKHAGAHSVEIDLRVEDDVVLTVRDDGRGFAPGGRESGLRNIRHRAETLGGTSVLRSEPGRGTELTWTVPLVAGRVRGRDQEDRSPGRQRPSAPGTEPT